MNQKNAEKKVDALLRNPTIHLMDDLRWVVRQHLVDLFKENATLVGSPASATDGYGFSIRLDGTIPINFRGTVYHIPCMILLPTEYPHRAPVAYVVPTSTMVIASSHPQVDRHGTVHLPYLVHWNYQSSNLVGMCREMIREFSRSPPLFAKSVQTASPAHAGTQRMYTHTQQNQNQYYSSQPANHPPCTMHPEVATCTKQELEGLVRQRFVEILTQRTRDRLQMQSQRASFQCDALESQAQVLTHRGAEMATVLQGVTHEKEALESALMRLGDASKNISKWLDRNEHKSHKHKAKMKVEDILQPADVWTKQALECQSQDAAIEDTLLALDRCMQSGRMDLDVYLKNVRNQCRDQFFTRALALKIAVEQTRVGSDQGPRPTASQPHYSRSRHPNHQSLGQDTWGLLNAAAGSAGLSEGKIRYPSLP